MLLEQEISATLRFLLGIHNGSQMKSNKPNQGILVRLFVDVTRFQDVLARRFRRVWRTVRVTESRLLGPHEAMPMSVDHTHMPDHTAPDAGVLVREGTRVDLRRHVVADRDRFLAWYQDAEIAEMLRHDLSPLTENQARSYFDSIIMPSTARGTCWAIHEHGKVELVGSTAIVDINQQTQTSLFRLVIGEKPAWGRGYGTEATELALAEAFIYWKLRKVNLEVFSHNPRALGAYRRVGFRQTGKHHEWVPRALRQIEVNEMSITALEWFDRNPDARWESGDHS